MVDDNYIINRLIDILNSKNQNLLIGNIISPRPGSICQVSTPYGIKSAYNINCTYPGNAIVVWDKDEEQYYCFTTNPSTVLSSTKLSYRKNRETPIKLDKINIAILVVDNINTKYILTNNSFTNFNNTFNEAAIKLYGNTEGKWEIYTRTNTNYRTYKNKSEQFNETNDSNLTYIGNGVWSSTAPSSVSYNRVLVSNVDSSFNNNWILRVTDYDCFFLSANAGFEHIETYVHKFLGTLATKLREISITNPITQGYIYKNINIKNNYNLTYYKNSVYSNHSDLLTSYTLQHTTVNTGSSITYLLPTKPVNNSNNFNTIHTATINDNIITVNSKQSSGKYEVFKVLLNGHNDQYIYQLDTKLDDINETINTKYFIKDFESIEVEVPNTAILQELLTNKKRVSWLKKNIYYIKNINFTTLIALVDVYNLQGTALIKVKENIEVKFKKPPGTLSVLAASYYID